MGAKGLTLIDPLDKAHLLHQLLTNRQRLCRYEEPLRGDVVQRLLKPTTLAQNQAILLHSPSQAPRHRQDRASVLLIDQKGTNICAGLGLE